MEYKCLQQKVVASTEVIAKATNQSETQLQKNKTRNFTRVVAKTNVIGVILSKQIRYPLPFMN